MKKSIDIIKYFMRFPAKAAVLDNFKKTIDVSSGYSSLKSYVENLPAGILPDLTGFVWGIDNDVFANKLKNNSGYLMLVEVEQIDSSPDKMKVNAKNINMGVSISHLFDSKNTDLVDQQLIMDTCEDLMLQLIQQIELEDSTKCFSSRIMNAGYRLFPIEPTLFFGRIGWVLRFTKEYDE